MIGLPNPAKHTSPIEALDNPIPLDALPTPALLVDEARLMRNLAGMQQLAAESGVRLRPHGKTHKSPILARLQQQLGAEGMCAAKVGEAEVFLAAGIRDVLVAYPIVGRRAEALARLAVAAGPGGSVAGTVDDEAGVAAMAAAARAHGVKLGVWIEVDTGLRRSGLLPEDSRLDTLAEMVRREPGIRLRGLLTHAGHVYKAQPQEVETIGRHEAEALVETARRLDRAGLGPVEVGLGSTPTVPVSARIEGVHEIHAGVYVFGDRQQVRLRAMHVDDVSLTVLATVVSRPARDRWVVDAGSKTLSSDQGAHGVKGLDGYGTVRLPVDHREPDSSRALPFARGLEPVSAETNADEPRLARLSEEHGVIEGNHDLPARPGDLVEITPNHACPVANLAEWLYVTRGAGMERRAIAMWPVAARARTF